MTDFLRMVAAVLIAIVAMPFAWVADVLSDLAFWIDADE